MRLKKDRKVKDRKKYSPKNLTFFQIEDITTEIVLPFFFFLKEIDKFSNVNIVILTKNLLTFFA